MGLIKGWLDSCSHLCQVSTNPTCIHNLCLKKEEKRKKKKKKSCGAVIILLPIENNVDYIVLALFIHVWILQLQTWLHFTNCYAHMIIKLHLYWGIYKQGTGKITRDTCSLSAEQNQVHKPGYRVITWKIIHHYRTLIIFS